MHFAKLSLKIWQNHCLTDLTHAGGMSSAVIQHEFQPQCPLCCGIRVGTMDTGKERPVDNHSLAFGMCYWAFLLLRDTREPQMWWHECDICNSAGTLPVFSLLLPGRVNYFQVRLEALIKTAPVRVLTDNRNGIFSACLVSSWNAWACLSSLTPVVVLGDSQKGVLSEVIF